MNETMQAAVKRLKEANRVLILTHRWPDGDAAGSAGALCAALRQLGKPAFVLDTAEWTDLYGPYVAPYTIAASDYSAERGDVIVAVDTASPQRLQYEAEPYEKLVDVAIDHHLIHVPYAPLVCIDPSAAACGEVIYEIIQSLGVPVSPCIADMLFLSLSGDTGGFRYANTTSRTMRVAAELMDAGADAAGINRTLYEIKSHARIKLERAILDGMAYHYGGAVAVCCLTASLQREIGAGEAAYENISAIPRGIEGVQIALIVREVGGGQSKVSARGLVDVAAVCAAVGGGGHKAAAGALVKGTADEVRDRLLAVIEELYGGTF